MCRYREFVDMQDRFHSPFYICGVAGNQRSSSQHRQLRQTCLPLRAKRSMLPLATGMSAGCPARCPETNSLRFALPWPQAVPTPLQAQLQAL